jgi:hypothetical protein
MYQKYSTKLIFTFTRFDNLGREFQTQLHQEALQVIEE